MYTLYICNEHHYGHVHVYLLIYAKSELYCVQVYIPTWPDVGSVMTFCVV